MKRLAVIFTAMLPLLFSLHLMAFALDGDSKARSIEKQLLNLPRYISPSSYSRIERIACVKGQLSKFIEVPITCRGQSLRENDRKVLRKLIEASRFIDTLFLRQVFKKNEEIRRRLQASRDPLDVLTLRYFLINYGPFDRLNDYISFTGDFHHSRGANFYPDNFTREEMEEWLNRHPEDREAFTSDFTVIRRKGESLVAVPYSQEYADLLTPAARALREAVQFSDNQSLRTYLELRAKAFKTNNYYESDLAWMDIRDSRIELVIGPYEVYEDQLFNYKASFESFVILNLPDEAKQFTEYTSYLKDMEANLPIDDSLKNLDKDFSSPIRIAHLVFSAGDGRAGVHTSAFALPNDERVRKERGCKKIMLKNIMAAKFKGSTFPIARKIIDPSQLCHAQFDGYFRDTVFHELSHGLGPGVINLSDGTRKDVRICLRENYSSIEECKADTLSVYNQLFLMEKGVIPRGDYKTLCVSYLAGLFRSVRFGIDEAHGKGSLIQLNWMMEKKAISYDTAKGNYRVNFDLFADANKSLAARLLEIQARGDYEESVKFLARYARCPGHLVASLKKLYEIPVDIEPVFDTESI